MLIGPAESSIIPNMVQPSRIRLLSWLLSGSEENLPSLWPARLGGALLAKASSRAPSSGLGLPPLLPLHFSCMKLPQQLKVDQEPQYSLRLRITEPLLWGPRRAFRASGPSPYRS